MRVVILGYTDTGDGYFNVQFERTREGEPPHRGVLCLDFPHEGELESADVVNAVQTYWPRATIEVAA